MMSPRIHKIILYSTCQELERMQLEVRKRNEDSEERYPQPPSPNASDKVDAGVMKYIEITGNKVCSVRFMT